MRGQTTAGNHFARGKLDKNSNLKQTAFRVDKI